MKTQSLGASTGIRAVPWRPASACMVSTGLCKGDCLASIGQNSVWVLGRTDAPDWYGQKGGLVDSVTLFHLEKTTHYSYDPGYLCLFLVV